MDERVFLDRQDAGRRLAGMLKNYAHREDVIVLALPRGGVPVGFEVAKALGVGLDVLVVRKLGLPYHTELAMGAIASGGAVYLNRDVIDASRVSAAAIDVVLRRESAELARREVLYRGDRPWPDVAGKTVIVVDDGIATGATAHAAIVALRSHRPARIVLAVPVTPPDTRDQLAAVADEVVCVTVPERFYAVGQFYRQFEQTSDDTVRALLERARKADA